MTEKPDSSASTVLDTEQTVATVTGVWAQLGALAARSGTDHELRLLVEEAIVRHHELRGVTATIAHRYRSMIDAVPDAITIHDESGRTLDANASACRLFDQDRSALLDRSANFFPIWKKISWHACCMPAVAMRD